MIEYHRGSVRADHPTILSSNLTAGELLKKYPTKISSVYYYTHCLFAVFAESPSALNITSLLMWILFSFNVSLVTYGTFL